MLFCKMTDGFVVQVFNDAGEFLGQRFVADDTVAFYTGEGDFINRENMPLGGDEYAPFDMAQPIVRIDDAAALDEALSVRPL